MSDKLSAERKTDVLVEDLAVASPLKEESSSVPLSEVASSVTAARERDRDRCGCGYGAAGGLEG